MTSTQTDSSGDAAGDDGQPQNGEGSKKNIGVRIALIGAAGIILAALIALIPPLFAQDSDENPNPNPSTGDTSKTDPCDLDRLEDGGGAWVQPSAQRFNSKLFADRQPRVLTEVDSDQNPGISVRGQVNLTIPSRQVLFLVRRPDRNSKDESGNPGSDQYYPATQITPDSDGCWEDSNRRLGYDGAKGITEIYYLVLVGEKQAAEFTKDRHAEGFDGYSYARWQSEGAIDVLSFRVPTVT
ncbi:hypothetical protein [Streptomyces phaeochromogenes]|uniref:hypothetical protein n=1 Tax=Streptomyces phaeochromogenes TaxID=1923 RepID=UPI002DD935C6|nr:hypothetical protein [Streptomyces phaeochromogenes]WRZ29989.1 hypothetical protein OG931_20670 [Streptomyces phaeochromogenes]